MAIAALLVLGVSSCVGFFFWVSRPGTLLEPSKLRASDTTGYVECTLRLDDPGSKKLFDGLIAAGDRGGEQVRRVMPYGVGNWLAEKQHSRNRKKLSELFPLVAAWTMHPRGSPGDDLHLLTVSLEKLGNRIVLIDRCLEYFLQWSDDVKSVTHDGDTIHQLPSKDGEGTTFFIHGNDLFFTSDIETARQALDRLTAGPKPGPKAGAGESGDEDAAGRAGSAGGDDPAIASPGVPESGGEGAAGDWTEVGAGSGEAASMRDLETLLATVPAAQSIRGAIVNTGGEIDRLWQWLEAATEASDESTEGGEESAGESEDPADDDDGKAAEVAGVGEPRKRAGSAPEPSPWQGVEALTIQGGFTAEGDIDLTVTALHRSDWDRNERDRSDGQEHDGQGAVDPDAMAASLGRALRRLGVEPELTTVSEPGQVRITVKVPDLASRLERVMDEIGERTEHRHRRTLSIGQ